ncbi:MurR/RpiR family transcriptional regulator [Bifidobacterium sp. MA2]|uniref:MurR/RpiR family transcriptional regulator n=1 Tax=Bifidobacterium santillanense TaxID=2809028 RepID=A0ABS5UNH0_9BIFI|nr:hypothetical protein [Bifidobacterium santillanense]MBT1172429.1 MurR/RpiR family transcriptional regulator [Bifidobacterium santillanense]
MGMLLNRLLIILIEEDMHSTRYHIALTMLEHYWSIQNMTIDEMAALCAVAKSTISKFCRSIGFPNYPALKESVPRNASNRLTFDKMNLGYMTEHGTDEYIDRLAEDVAAQKALLEDGNIDRLAIDLTRYDKVAAFGLVYSETAAIDLQSKLAYDQKFIYTAMRDDKQHEFVASAGEDTLIIVFSYSGDYLLRQQLAQGDVRKNVFKESRARIVCVTANPEVAKSGIADYCITMPNPSGFGTHSVLYPIVTDLIAFKYRRYAGLADS